MPRRRMKFRRGRARHARQLSRIDLDAARYGIGDMLLADDAEHVAGPWQTIAPAVAAHDDRDDGVPAPHPPDHVEGDVVLSGERKVPRRDIAKGNVRPTLGNAVPERRIDPHDDKDAVALGDDDMAHAG